MNKTRIIDNKPAQTYSSEWLEQNQENFINEDFVKNWHLAPEYLGNFLKPIWNNSEWIEGATPEEIAQQQIINLKQKETDLYIKRIQDAQRIWAGLSAEFRIAKQVGQMDDATENIILAELKPVLDIVVPFGQWVTGYQLLLGVGSSVIGQPLYDKIHNILWNYIQENYEEMEVEQLRNQINKK